MYALLTCTMTSSVDLAHYSVSHAKDWVFVDCGTNSHTGFDWYTSGEANSATFEFASLLNRDQL